MRLTTLELSGFKSFAQKTTLEFPASIIEIVGPNGSGKSNIAEAFRFVLGEQSIKSLRGKKGEDLIFGGSSTRARANRASAKIVFDNADRFLNIDFDTVEVERVVHRDGTNKYKINGSSVRLRDVMELLVGANIGATGHHIISQGQADKMLSVGSVERKGIIEDSLGLKMYHYRIRESERKLDKTQENMREVESRRQELAPRVAYLKRQVEKVEKARVIRDELQDVYREYLKREEVYLSVHMKELDAHLETLETERTIKIKELEEARVSKVEERTSSDYADKISEVRREREEARRGRDELLRKLGTLEGEISSYRRVLERNPAEVEAVDTQTMLMSDVRVFTESIREHIARALNTNDLEEMRSVLARMREELEHFIHEPKTVPDQAYVQARTEAESALKELSLQKDNVEGELSILRVREDALRKTIEDLENAWHHDQSRSEEEKRRVLELTHAVERLDSKIERERERQHFLLRDKTRFEEELVEAGVLIGAYILQYKTYELVGKDGNPLTEHDIAHEDREAQEARRREIEKMKIRLEDMQVAGGEDAVKEYEDIVERDEFLSRELHDLENTSNKLRELIKDLQATLEREFDEGVKAINETFQHFFTLMFGGGEACLVPVALAKRPPIGVDTFDEAGEEDVQHGIDVVVKIPQKNIKNLHMLSGGERTLTSLAMLFAMSQVNPPPFLILDETDAALDEANSRRYGEMIIHLSKHSQLIIITHNRETMAHADVLYGVTMTKDGVSKILSIKFEEAEKQVVG